MKLVGVKEFYNITRAKVISAANCVVLAVVCTIATFVVDTALNSTAVIAQPVETTSDAFNPEQPDPTVPDTTDVTEPVNSTAPSAGASVPVETAAPTASVSASETSETSETAETTYTPDTEETEEETEAASPAETTEKVTEKELYLAVYATTAINVRSGPGTGYDVVKSLNAGDQIDVIAETSNGWYKTYNGNYVSKDYVSETKPASTPKTTSKQTEAESTTREETTEAETTTEAEVETPSGSGNTCTITFYGPQPNGDGTYNNSTATGTTCTEGRTCAADWSIYPAGTVIYIENDPLGGDGYYTVEDRGPGVKGYHIDIYADDGETGSHRTCSRTVYAQ